MLPKPLLLIIVLLFCCAQLSFAGFIKNKPVVIAATYRGAYGERVVDSAKMNSRARCFNENYRRQRPAHYGEGGWAAIVSYICAYTFILGPLAVIFGAIGLGRSRNHHLAVRGFVYGIISTVVLAAIFMSILLY